MPSSELPILVFSAVLGITPGLVFWTIVILFTRRWMKNESSRAEHFLIAGAIIYIVSTLLYVPILLMPFLINENIGSDPFLVLQYTTGLVRDIINLSGVICFIYAFWVKFNARNSATAE